MNSHNEDIDPETFKGLGVCNMGGSDRLNEAIMNLVKVIYDTVFDEVRRKQVEKGEQSNAVVLANLNIVTLQVMKHLITISLKTQQNAVIDMLTMQGHSEEANEHRDPLA